jgi:hypothetical protein
MAVRWASVFTLPVFAVLLAILTFGVIILGRAAGLGVDSLFLLAIPIAAAGAYLAWYRTLPVATPPARPRPDEPSAVDDEPFDDPVEEAVLMDEEKEEAGLDYDTDEPLDETPPRVRPP